jgi:hypothetical protein
MELRTLKEFEAFGEALKRHLPQGWTVELHEQESCLDTDDGSATVEKFFIVKSEPGTKFEAGVDWLEDEGSAAYEEDYGERNTFRSCILQSAIRAAMQD